MSAARNVALSVDGLTVLRGGDRVLDGLCLEIGVAERVCVHGENGAGKSSLLLAILGFLRTAGGRIEILGRACADEAQFAAIRGPAALLFQDSDDQLFCSTVGEDVAFGPQNMACTPAEVNARTRDALGSLGILALHERPIQQLSGGEKRLVALAGLLAMRPRLLLLDEPAAGLAPAAAARLTAALDALDIAMLIVSHEPSLAEALGARQLQLVDGRLRSSANGDSPRTGLRRLA